jgi:fructose-1,6-bisphosphatase
LPTGLSSIAEAAESRRISPGDSCGKRDGALRILDILASDLHHRTPLVIGSKEDVEEYLSFYK